MKSKIFLCLLLIAVMFAFTACGTGDNGTGMLNNGIDDISRDMDRMVDDIDGDMNGYGMDNSENGRSWNASSIKNDGTNNNNRVTGGALANDIL